MSLSENTFKSALENKKIPILTLDNKWHRLFTQTNSNAKIKQLESELNELLKRQGKLNTESKGIKKIKTKLMDEIVDLMDNEEKSTNKKLEDNKRLINECNEKIEAYQDELLDLPKEIDSVNKKLMIETMTICYQLLQENTTEVEKIAEWITQVRIELKKNIIRKQEKELINQELYSYMHDLFGADVIEIFDMKYNPAENKIKESKSK